ncbi:MAG TPA: CYTH and CHAD domain-containing protein [Actinomycetota bacterium]|nr:CYTH and CHAD domain-containing protein [Actinomycetota bacterium]
MSRPDRHAERETKLQAPAGFRLPDLSGDGLVAGPPGERRYATVYLDTPELDIARWGSSLRHREGEGWTVKLPSRTEGEMLVRGEHVFDGEADNRHPPDPAVDLLRAYVRDRPLVPSVRLRTVRRSVALADELGRTVAEVTDDEVSVMDGRRVASRFRELEVELAAGTPDEVLHALVDRLHEAGAGPVDNVSKLRRALGPRAERPPELVLPEIDKAATVAEVVRRALAASVVRLLRHDAGVRLGEDPEQVHQARVGARRLRSDLRTFRDALDPAWAGGLRDELKWLGRELGAVRDAEVLRDRLGGRRDVLDVADRKAADTLLRRLDARQAAARDKLVHSMRLPRYAKLLDALVEGANAPAVLPELAEAPASEALRAALQAPWKHLETAMETVGQDPTDEHLHAARIRAKRVRYAADAVSPVFGKRARGFAKAAVDLQDVLGEHQDAVVAGAWLREAARSGSDPFVAGELAAIEAQAAAASREAVPAAWKALSRKRLRFWA